MRQPAPPPLAGRRETIPAIDRLLEDPSIDPALARYLRQKRRTAAGRTSEPQPGFFTLKLRRKGVLVPALIWQPCPWIDPIPGEDTPDRSEWCLPAERSRPLLATIGQWPASPLEVWSWGQPIGEAEYRWRIDLAAWARENAPSAPEARPRREVRLDRSPSLF